MTMGGTPAAGSGVVRRCAALISLLLLATTASQAADEAAPPRTSIETFFRNPDIGAAKLSPSGKWLAITTATKTSRIFLAVVKVGDDKVPPKVLASFSDVDINSYAWVNDERLVFNTIDTLAPARDQRFGPGLYSVKRDGSEMRMLIRPQWISPISDGSRAGGLEPNHQLVATLDDGGDDVLVAESKFSMVGEPVLVVPKRLNTATGRTTSLALGAPSNTLGWVFDRTGRPRVAVSESKGRVEVAWRPTGQDAWTPLASFSALRPAFVPLAVHRDELFVAAPSGEGHAVLKRFDFATGKPASEAMVEAPGFDLNPVLWTETGTGRLLGIRYETDAPSTIWLDPVAKRLQALADARFPGQVNDLQCRHCSDGGIVMVHSYSDRDPGSYWLYDIAAESWELVGKARKAIDPRQMAQLDFYRTQARDGEDLPIWITMPNGTPDKPRAAVVLVHGGPWVRGGHWHWDADAQFLASRGYVVIEPEFRGSTGYGEKHLEKGFKQWGLTMQDDLADAVQWAATKGMIDPKRVCIAGASYGGYATLMGLVRNPDLYRCGVAWVAVTDPRLLFANSWSSDISQEAIQYSLPVMLGDPDKDAALLKDAAPVEHAKEIRAPLLLAFGGNDVRVPLEHGTSLRRAMESAGLHPEFVVYDGEGHGFLKVENRVDFYTRMEKFLAKNLQ